MSGSGAGDTNQQVEQGASGPGTTDTFLRDDPPKDVVIYHFPTSYSSQKVLISVFEKQLKFKAIVVSLFHDQHMEPWYVRLNPNGAHVPVLVHGDRVINDPDRIVDYVDKLQGDIGPQLVPEPATAVGEQVEQFRESLEKIPVDVISYGVIFHPELSDEGCQLPVAIQRSMRENFAKRLRYLITLSTIHPDLRDCYLAKSQTAAEKYDLITDFEKVKGQMEQLTYFLHKVESGLKDRYSVEEQDVSGAMYLFGDSLTIADIGLYVLITRLQILGLLTKFVPEEHFPLTLRHYSLVAARPSIKKLSKEMSKLRYTLLIEDIKASGSYLAMALGAGMVVVAAYYLIKKVRS